MRSNDDGALDDVTGWCSIVTLLVFVLVVRSLSWFVVAEDGSLHVLNGGSLRRIYSDNFFVAKPTLV